MRCEGDGGFGWKPPWAIVEGSWESEWSCYERDVPMTTIGEPTGRGAEEGDLYGR